MGLYRVTNGAVGKALVISGGNDTITTTSAWEFENQTGTLGTNLTGSLVYSGAGGNINVILSDAVGVQGSVTGLNIQPTFTGANPSYAGFSAGTGYTTGAALATTAVSLIPSSVAKAPAGLTVDVTATGGVVDTIVINAVGANYNVGDVITISGGGNGDCKFVIASVADLAPTSNDAVNFQNVPAGTILQVAVDYVLATGTTATAMIACK
tara:strand:+ start:1417 stop:2046 length:630 start_codon:yes stop_codon:yes gene_type:complete